MSDVWKQFGENATSDPSTDKKIVQSLKTFEGLDKMSVRIIVHGFGSSCSHVWIYEMRTALMAVVSSISLWLFNLVTEFIYRKTVLLFVLIGKMVRIYQIMLGQLQTQGDEITSFSCHMKISNFFMVTDLLASNWRFLYEIYKNIKASNCHGCT